MRYARVLPPEERFEDPAVGVKTRAEEDRIIVNEELGELLLEVPVRALAPADEANAGKPVASLPNRSLGRSHDVGVVGKAEVVVRAEVEHPPSAHLDLDSLRRRDLAFLLPGAGGPDLSELSANDLLGARREHDCLRPSLTVELQQNLGLRVDLLLERSRIEFGKVGDRSLAPVDHH